MQKFQSIRCAYHQSSIFVALEDPLHASQYGSHVLVEFRFEFLPVRWGVSVPYLLKEYGHVARNTRGKGGRVLLEAQLVWDFVLCYPRVGVACVGLVRVPAPKLAMCTDVGGGKVLNCLLHPIVVAACATSLICLGAIVVCFHERICAEWVSQVVCDETLCCGRNARKPLALPIGKAHSTGFWIGDIDIIFFEATGRRIKYIGYPLCCRPLGCQFLVIVETCLKTCGDSHWPFLVAPFPHCIGVNVHVRVLLL